MRMRCDFYLGTYGANGEVMTVGPRLTNWYINHQFVRILWALNLTVMAFAEVFVVQKGSGVSEQK